MHGCIRKWGEELLYRFAILLMDTYIYIIQTLTNTKFDIMGSKKIFSHIENGTVSL